MSRQPKDIEDVYYKLEYIAELLEKIISKETEVLLIQESDKLALVCKAKKYDDIVNILAEYYQTYSLELLKGNVKLSLSSFDKDVQQAFIDITEVSIK